jgi:hypothetical protein
MGLGLSRARRCPDPQDSGGTWRKATAAMHDPVSDRDGRPPDCPSDVPGSDFTPIIGYAGAMQDARD